MLHCRIFLHHFPSLSLHLSRTHRAIKSLIREWRCIGSRYRWSRPVSHASNNRRHLPSRWQRVGPVSLASRARPPSTRSCWKIVTIDIAYWYSSVVGNHWQYYGGLCRRPCELFQIAWTASGLRQGAKCFAVPAWYQSLLLELPNSYPINEQKIEFNR
jgi:hypothetical protein